MDDIKVLKGTTGKAMLGAYYQIGGKDFKKFRSNVISEPAEWNSFSEFTVRFMVEYSFMRPNKDFQGYGDFASGVGQFGFSATWKAEFTENGLELSQNGVQPRIYGSQKHVGAIGVAADAKVSEGKGKDPFVEVVVTIVVAQADPGIDIGGGFGASVSRNLRAFQESVTTQLQYRVRFEIKKQPHKKPNISRDLLERKAYFGKIGEYKLPSSSLTTLDRWINDIKRIEELHEAIKAGKLTIHLDGNTSKSGSKAFNASLAKQRIDHVERQLNSRFGSSKVSYDKNPKAQSEYEEENDYRVDIYFHKEDAEKAIAEMYP